MSSFLQNSERTLSAYFQFSPDGFGSRCACVNSGASHFYYFNRQKSSQIVNLPALLFFYKKIEIKAIKILFGGFMKRKVLSIFAAVSFLFIGMTFFCCAADSSDSSDDSETGGGLEFTNL